MISPLYQHNAKECTMNLSHIEHIGIAVKSLDEAIPFWEKQLGMKCYSIEEVKEQRSGPPSSKSGNPKSNC